MNIKANHISCVNAIPSITTGTGTSDPVVKDSGARRVFSSGAVRDIAEGKGRMDLIPLDVVRYILNVSTSLDKSYVNIVEKIHEFKCRPDDTNIGSLCIAIHMFCELHCWNIFECMLEVSHQYEDGAKKYGENNWQKGLPISCYIDSALRHLFKYASGWKDEPHDRAFVWNLISAIWTVLHIETKDISQISSTSGGGVTDVAASEDHE